MLKITAPINTPFGLQVGNTVWRWISLQIDPGAGNAVIGMGAFPTAEIAAAVGTPTQKPPLLAEAYNISGFEFLSIVGGAPSGPTLSDAVSNAIYNHLKAVVPKFTGAEDVSLPPTP